MVFVAVHSNPVFAVLNRSQQLHGHSGAVWSVAWQPLSSSSSSSAPTLASCGSDKSVQLWRGAAASSSLGALCALDDVRSRTVRRVAWAPDGARLAAASFDGTVTVWQQQRQTHAGDMVDDDVDVDNYDGGDGATATAWRCVATLEGHENEVKCVAFDASGALLATCGRDKTVWIWEFDEATREFECVSVCHGHSQDVKCVVWHPRDELLVSTAYDDTLRVWKADDDDWTCTATLTGHTGTVWAAAFSRDGALLLSCSDDRSLRLWRYAAATATFACIQTIAAVSTRPLFSVAWSAASDLVAVGAGDNAIYVFGRASAGADELTLLGAQKQAHESDVNAVAWSGDGALLASAGDDSVINLWHVALKN